MSTALDTIPAGRDLDALVAERVMGWHVQYTRIGDYWMGATRHDPTWSVKEFTPSTDIAAAWLVVERMREQEWAMNLDVAEGDKLKPYDCRLFNRDGRRRVLAYGETFPLAICRAALKAIHWPHE